MGWCYYLHWDLNWWFKCWWLCCCIIIVLTTLTITVWVSQMFSRSYTTIHHPIIVQTLCCIITVAGVIQLSSTMCAGGKDIRAPGYPVLGTCIVWNKVGTCIVWSLLEAGIVLCDTYWAPCCDTHWVLCCIVWYLLGTVLFCVIRAGCRVVLCDTYWWPCFIVWYVLEPCVFIHPRDI